MENTGILKSYITGFVLSIVLTLGSYFAVVNHLFSGSGLLIVILSLAVVQLIVQLVFFLHIGHEEGSRWNLFMLISTVGLVLLIVVGSIWIMDHLNYNMSPQQMDKAIMMEEGIKK